MSEHTPTPTITEYWNDAAPTFDAVPDHGLRDADTRAAWARLLAGWIPAGSRSVLDVGCGTGTLSLLLAADGHRVTGVDLAPRMVAEARAKQAATGHTARFLVGDAAAPPVGEDARFDVVLARHLLWTLPQPEAALRRWCGLLRPGGVLILVEGRWAEAAPGSAPYAADAELLPWPGGVGAAQLADTVRPLVASLRIEQLGDDPQLWGRPVTDERYALIAQV